MLQLVADDGTVVDFHAWLDSFKCIQMCDTTHFSQKSQRATMGWLQLVGSLKLKVSFAKDPDERDYILQKRPIILRSLLIVATPY